MIVVDSSVWIDFLSQRSRPASEWLNARLDMRQFVIGDLMLAEVLQGCDTDREFAATRAELRRFDLIGIVDEQVAVKSARNYRALRARGITIRKTIDTLIATRCILDDIPLLYSDRDFDPFVAHLGLRSAMDLDTGVN